MTDILLLLLLLLLSMLLVQGLMEDTYVQLINCRLHLFRSSASSFSSQYLLFFSNHQGAVFFFFLLFSLPSSVLQWHYEKFKKVSKLQMVTKFRCSLCTLSSKDKIFSWKYRFLCHINVSQKGAIGYWILLIPNQTLILATSMAYGNSMPHSQGLSNNPYPRPNEPNFSYWYLSL